MQFENKKLCIDYVAYPAPSVAGSFEESVSVDDLEAWHTLLVQNMEIYQQTPVSGN